MKTKIMFVCHGNICRSPMAELIFRHLAREAGVEDRFEVASSATSTEEIWGGVGNPVYPPAIAELQKHGIGTPHREAVLLRACDYGKYDLIVAMDRKNISGIMRIIGGDSQNKVSRLMDHTGRPRDVADPWYTGRFDVTYSDIYEGCLALLEKLSEKL